MDIQELKVKNLTPINVMKKIYLPLIYLCLNLWLLCGGCGNPSVIGIVTFDDGTPVTMGYIKFVKSPFQATGMIQPDGSYKMNELQEGSGVSKGTYKVTVSSQNQDASGRLVYLVDPKFESVDTSGLVCEVKGNTIYNIVVTRPIQQSSR
jgi:hypothetical protein